jgi:hypothetical protein
MNESKCFFHPTCTAVSVGWKYASLTLELNYSKWMFLFCRQKQNIARILPSFYFDSTHLTTELDTMPLSYWLSELY